MVCICTRPHNDWEHQTTVVQPTAQTHTRAAARRVKHASIVRRGRQYNSIECVPLARARTRVLCVQASLLTRSVSVFLFRFHRMGVVGPAFSPPNKRTTVARAGSNSVHVEELRSLRRIYSPFPPRKHIILKPRPNRLGCSTYFCIPAVPIIHESHQAAASSANACSAEVDACRAEQTCADCLAAATGDHISSCTTRYSSCSGFVDMFCCIYGDSCSDNAALVSYVGKQ